jgi:Bacterial PH domain
MTKKNQAVEDGWKRPRGLTLRDGESIIMVLRPSRALSIPKYVYTLGLYGFWRKRQTYVVTDQRVLAGRGLFNRTENSIPISRIEDVTFVRRGPGAYLQVVLMVRGRRRMEYVGPLLPRDARRMAGEIQARL